MLEGVAGQRHGAGGEVVGGGGVAAPCLRDTRDFDGVFGGELGGILGPGIGGGDAGEEGGVGAFGEDEGVGGVEEEEEGGEEREERGRCGELHGLGKECW